MGEMMNSNYKNKHNYQSHKANDGHSRLFCYETSELIGECQEDIKNGFYKEARKKINDLKAAGNKGVVWKIQSLLEADEYNFNRAFDLIERRQDEPSQRTKSQDEIIYNLAIIYLVKGDLNIAAGLFETLLQSQSHKNYAYKYLVYIDLIKGKYNRAMASIGKLPTDIQETYRVQQIKIFLANVLGDDIPEDSEMRNTYFYKSLNATGDWVLINHLKHLYTGDLDDQDYSCRFDASVDFQELVAKVKREISALPPTYIDYRRRYILRFPEDIGYVGGHLTKAVCVQTFPHNGQIFNMAPIQISKQFDKENYIARTRKKN